MKQELSSSQLNTMLIEQEKVFGGFTLKILDRKTAEQYVDVLTMLLDQIPQVEYTKEDVLAESKDDGERVFYGKWEHSLILFDKDKPIAVVIGYERISEHNDQYPENTIYISELAVDPKYQQQGIARKILNIFFEMNNAIGFLHLDGTLNFSIQTNSAEWNKHVRDLYSSFGFVQRATKTYPNRIDVILGGSNIAPSAQLSNETVTLKPQ